MRTRIIACIVALTAVFGLSIAVAPAASASPQLCSAANPCAFQQTFTGTYATIRVRGCFDANGYQDWNSVQLTNVSGASHDFGLSGWREDLSPDDSLWFADTRTVANGSTTTWDLTNDAVFDPPKRPNGYEQFVDILQDWGTHPRVPISPFYQGNGEDYFGYTYKQTLDVINDPSAWSCT